MILLRSIAVSVIFVLTACSSKVSIVERKKLFNNDWKFFRGTVINGEFFQTDDSEWRSIDLPHDWSIEPLPNQTPDSIIGPFSKASVGGFATGQTLGGEGWYRKTFIITPEDGNKRHELYFEGIYNQSEIWINGKKIYHNVYGYSSFRFDITEYCKPAGQENLIAVKVLNEGKNSRWYSGSGIYRHVWLITKASTYLEDWGTFIQTKKVHNIQAEIVASTSIISNNAEAGNFELNIELISPEGKTVGKSNKQILIENEGKTEISFNLNVDNPQLWSPDGPNMYSAKFTLTKSKEIIDQLIVPCGIRTIKFTGENGFELNGKPILLKGGCVHHGHGLLGAAAFDDAEERKIRLLKQNGFNSVRTAHNPMSESFLNACDRLGMLVINEAFDQWNHQKNPDDYHLYFKEWSAKDVRNLVLRDRNHPSVIMWSIGNEIRERISDEGRETARYLKSEILKYDTTRPITAGVNKYWNNDRTEMLPLDNAMVHQDVLGYNYMWRFFEQEHAKYPKKAMYSSEGVATEAAQNWDKAEKLPYVIGDFVWTAIDYLGESGLGSTIEVNPQENVHQFQGWPWYNGWSGDIDLIGIKKPQSYYRDVLWRERNISMAVEVPVPKGKIRKVSFWGWPEENLSWSFPGMENKPLKVNVYTRAPKVRLYLNDNLIGDKETDSLYTSSFEVPYQPGKLKAVEIIDGNECAEVVLETVGKPASLKLTAERKNLIANGQDLAYVLIELVDEKGQVILDDYRKIEINCTGAGELIGSGNASPNDMKSFGSTQPSLFKGRALAIIRAGKTSGAIQLKVTSELMKEARIKLEIE